MFRCAGWIQQQAVWWREHTSDSEEGSSDVPTSVGWATRAPAVDLLRPKHPGVTPSFKIHICGDLYLNHQLMESDRHQRGQSFKSST